MDNGELRGLNLDICRDAGMRRSVSFAADKNHPRQTVIVIIVLAQFTAASTLEEKGTSRVSFVSFPWKMDAKWI